MTIKLIDDALNIAIAGLVYGSEIWLTCAFVLYVLRSKERRAKTEYGAIERRTKIERGAKTVSLTAPQPGITITIEPIETLADETFVTPLVDGPRLDNQPLDSQPLRVQSLEMADTAQAEAIADNEVNLDSRPVREMANSSRPTKKTMTVEIERLSVAQKDFSAKDASQSQAVSHATVAQVTAVHPNIVCAPVDWKRWRVGDLRKASIYKACGVRIRPIGSRRNLPKADLIAQYEQNLKRLTKQPPLPVARSVQTA